MEKYKTFSAKPDPDAELKIYVKKEAEAKKIAKQLMKPPRALGDRSIQQFDKINGVFKPKRLDDLNPGVILCVGMYCLWEALWLIEDGRYAGQWAMSPRLSVQDLVNLPFVWVPECDVDID